MSRRRIADVAILLAAVALLTWLVAMRESASKAMQSSPSTYDYGGNGYAALYRLLEREHVAVRRYESPDSEIAAQRGTLVLAADAVFWRFQIAPQTLKALADWVRSGGTLVVMGPASSRVRDALHLPKERRISRSSATAGCGIAGRFTVSAPLAVALPGGCTASHQALLSAGGAAYAAVYREGRGRVVYVPATGIFDNLHLAGGGNAAFAYALFASLAPAAFDEAAHGYIVGNSFWGVLPLPVRAAIVLAAVALLLAILGANLPFAPPYRTPAGPERNSGEYIASLARMLARGGGERAVIDDLCRRMTAMLAPRAANDETARELLARVRALPSGGDLVAAGELFAHVRKEYAW